jgi:hypothetical protein
MRTQIGIIAAGLAGPMFSRLLHFFIAPASQQTATQ